MGAGVKHNILLVDDDELIQRSITMFLKDEGFFVKSVSNGEEAIAHIKQAIIPFSIALIDYHMPEMKGPEVIKKIKELNPQIHILGFSGDDSIESHNTSLDSGAIMFLPKNIDGSKFLGIIHRICREVERRSKPFSLEDSSVNCRLIKSLGIEGESDSLAQTAKLVLKIGPSNDCVLIRGENGTGKEVIAKALHENSQRRRGPFVAINCASIPEALIESELFGHEKGSFSGATSARIGKFQAASGGTLFLDEIGDMPFSLQAKLLRVLQEKEITPLGSNSTKKIDVRVIAATNANLESKILDKTFREDLFYRLNVLPITIAPLRERRADIPCLINYFMEIENKTHGTSKTILESCVLELKKWPWPGNVRDLCGAIKRLYLLTEGDIITEDSLSLLPKVKIENNETVLDYDSFRFRYEEDEKRMIVKALEKGEGVITIAAKVLGVSRETLRDKMKVLGIKNNITIKA